MDEEDLVVQSSPQGSGLNGNIFHKWSWALTKDYAFYLLELSLKKTLEQWKSYAEKYEKEQNLQDLKFAKSQVEAFELMLPKARLMDSSFMKKL